MYAVGHTRLTVRAHWLAAVLACGPEAVLSHHAAMALWELRPAPAAQIDVTAPGRRTHAGVRCHVSRTLGPADRTTVDGIPVTSLERALLDYAEIALPRQLRAALEAAQRIGRLHRRRVEALLERSSGRRGVTPLRAALQQLHDEAPWTQSGAERRLLELIRAAGLPEPRANVLVEDELVDCVWPAQRLVIELDSYGYHRSRRAFEDDRRRDTKLQLAGYRVVRLTRERLEHEPLRVIEDVRALVGSRPR